MRYDAVFFEERLRNHKLTVREVEVTTYWIMDYTYKEIADQLIISHYTVRAYIRSINRKLGVNSKASLILLLLNDGGPSVTGEELQTRTAVGCPHCQSG